MTPEDLAKHIAELAAQLAETNRKVANMEAQVLMIARRLNLVAEAPKAHHAPYDPTANFRLPASAVREMVERGGSDPRVFAKEQRHSPIGIEGGLSGPKS